MIVMRRWEGGLGFVWGRHCASKGLHAQSHAPARSGLNENNGLQRPFNEALGFTNSHRERYAALLFAYQRAANHWWAMQRVRFLAQELTKAMQPISLDV